MWYLNGLSLAFCNCIFSLRIWWSNISQGCMGIQRESWNFQKRLVSCCIEKKTTWDLRSNWKLKLSLLLWLAFTQRNCMYYLGWMRPVFLRSSGLEFPSLILIPRLYPARALYLSSLKHSLTSLCSRCCYNWSGRIKENPYNYICKIL